MKTELTAEAFMADFIPAPFRVIKHIKPTKRNQISKTIIVGIGNAHTIEAAQKIIDDDREAMGNTFGGLIEAPGSDGAVYRIFRAEWSAVECEA